MESLWDHLKTLFQVNSWQKDIRTQEERHNQPTVRHVNVPPDPETHGAPSDFILAYQGSAVVPQMTTQLLQDNILTQGWEESTVVVRTSAHATAACSVFWRIMDSPEIDAVLFQRTLTLSNPNVFGVLYNSHMPLIVDPDLHLTLYATNSMAAVPVTFEWWVYFHGRRNFDLIERS